MTKILLQQVDPHVALYRDSATGIAWIENGHTGLGHSVHANISASGSVRGMKKLGYWQKHDRCVRSHGWAYNIDTLVYDDNDPLDRLALAHCQCGGKH